MSTMKSIEIIIAGQPGSGKTAMAYGLQRIFCERGFEITDLHTEDPKFECVHPLTNTSITIRTQQTPRVPTADPAVGTSADRIQYSNRSVHRPNLERDILIEVARAAKAFVDSDDEDRAAELEALCDALAKVSP